MPKGSRKPSTTRSRARSRRARRTAWAFLVGSACAAGSSLASAQPAAPSATESAAPAAAPAGAPTGEPIVRLASRNEQIKVVERFSKVITLPDRIARVDGFDQEVIDVAALDSRSIRVHAKAPGVTTMTLVDERDQPYTVDVLVVGDVRHLQELLGRLFPDAAIDVVEVRESVVLRGWVTQPDQITEIVEIAEQFYPRVLNQMRVGCVQQVMLKVKVMEVQRSKLRQLGVNFLQGHDGGFIATTPGNIVPIQSVTFPYGGAPSIETTGIGRASVAFAHIADNSIFATYIEALKQENLLKILAEPELMTMNGRPANLLAGGEFPILVPNGLGTVSIQYKPFGVRLEAVPIVLSNNRVRIELQSEVSDQDLNNAVELEGFRVPSLTQRRANTQVELNFGQTLVIAGLISQGRTASTSKIPYLGDMPYIGAAFSRKTYSEAETELVIMVTPELVAPMTPDQLPVGGLGTFTDTPTDKELYFYNMLEVPSYGDRCQGQCPPPEPTYDPYHPTGPEHLGRMGGPMPGPGMPPAGYNPMVPPTPAPGMIAPETMLPVGPDPAATPDLPPPAPSPTTSAVGFPQRRPSAAAKAGKATGVQPAGHTRPAPGFGTASGARPAGKTTVRRPGLIEPNRPATGP